MTRILYFPGGTTALVALPGRSHCGSVFGETGEAGEVGEVLRNERSEEDRQDAILVNLPLTDVIDDRRGGHS